MPTAAQRAPLAGFRFGPTVTYFWLPVSLVTVWWWMSAGSTSFFFPPLSASLAVLWRDVANGVLIDQMLYSMRNVLTGLALVVVIGVGLGLLIGGNPRLRRAVWPLLAFLRAIPGVAIIPIVLVAMGVGPGPQIFIIVIGCVWPVLLNTVDGVRGMRESIVDTARAYRLTVPIYVRSVMLPSALPQIMAGLRISLSVSLTLMVVSDFSSGNAGLGHYIMRGVERFDIAQVWAGTIFVGVAGYLLNVVFVMIERRLLGWYFGIPKTPRRRKPQTTTEKSVGAEA